MMKIQYILIYLMILDLFGIIKLHQHHSDENFRSSAGFGIKFYSFIGPIAFTWGFQFKMKVMTSKECLLFLWAISIDKEFIHL